MESVATYRVPYATPRGVWEETASDPLRLIQVLLTTFMLGYGAREENQSPFTLKFLEAFVGSMFSAQEIFLIVILMLELVRRMMSNDWRLNRSPMTPHAIALFTFACLIPYLRMALYAGFRLPMELLLLPETLVVFFIFLFVFRPQELRFMAWMLAVCGLYKAVEGVAVYTTFGLKWGLLTGWRDAMLQTMTVLGGMLAMTIKPEGDLLYARLRKFLIWIFPLAVFSWVASNRRTYMIGLLVALPVLFYQLRKEERKRMRVMIVMLVGFGALTLAAVGFQGFLLRAQGVGDFSKENSAFDRVAENYNVAYEILQHPYVGYPMAKGWGNYTIFPQYSHLESTNVVLHNSYFYIWWRGGIIALLCWIWMIWRFARITLRAVKVARRPMDRFITYWLLSIPFILSFISITSPAWGDRLQVYLPFLMVMASYLPGVWGNEIPAPVGTLPGPAGFSGPLPPSPLPPEPSLDPERA